ncbi:hypothetical protein QYE76_012058 [Lolium multiflorum]|uniref:Uncharacterized protein n=1 Tax=Lolium multiflorum TaxID=4521 RepID=A0AAD8TWI7_LOLMU|nr:hypothetical protein QYE76_012058 [Lolium multiflorum]
MPAMANDIVCETALPVLPCSKQSGGNEVYHPKAGPGSGTFLRRERQIQSLKHAFGCESFEPNAVRMSFLERADEIGFEDGLELVIFLLVLCRQIFVLERFVRHLGWRYMASSINFNQFLEKEKLKSNGSNFTDWFRHVRIFLNGGNLQYVLDAPLGDPPAETETDEVKNVYMTRKTRYSQVQCAILCSLESDLQKRFEHHDPHELIKELKTIFETHAAVECYEASKHFFSCMMEEGSSIGEHMLVMTGHAKKLGDLGIVIPNRLGINRVLQSLPPSYKNFVMNYNMQNMNKEFPELFGMLKAAEIEIKKEHQVLMVNKTTSFKKQGKSKGKNKKSGKKVKPKSGLSLMLSAITAGEGTLEA